MPGFSGSFKKMVLPDAATMPAKYTFYQDYNMVTQGKPAGAIKDFIEFSHFQSGFTNWCGMMKTLRRFGLKDGELEGAFGESHQCDRHISTLN